MAIYEVILVRFIEAELVIEVEAESVGSAFDNAYQLAVTGRYDQATWEEVGSTYDTLDAKEA